MKTMQLTTRLTMLASALALGIATMARADDPAKPAPQSTPCPAMPGGMHGRMEGHAQAMGNMNHGQMHGQSAMQGHMNGQMQGQMQTMHGGQMAPCASAGASQPSSSAPDATPKN